jgi:hypothetical protein
VGEGVFEAVEADVTKEPAPSEQQLHPASGTEQVWLLPLRQCLPTAMPSRLLLTTSNSNEPSTGCPDQVKLARPFPRPRLLPCHHHLHTASPHCDGESAFTLDRVEQSTFFRNTSPLPPNHPRQYRQDVGRRGSRYHALQVRDW